MFPDQEAIKSLKFVCTKQYNFKMYKGLLKPKCLQTATLQEFCHIIYLFIKPTKPLLHRRFLDECWGNEEG